MNTPPHPRVNAQDRGLEDVPEIERPWSTPGHDTRRRPGPSARRGPRPAPVSRVVIEYEVVDGEDAQAVEERQTAAIREVLRCLRDRRAGQTADGPSTA